MRLERNIFSADIAEDVEGMFDTSDFPKDHPSVIPVEKNKKVIGMMKDECGGKIIKEFAALRPKLHSFLMDEGKEEKKAKGVKKSVVKKRFKA